MTQSIRFNTVVLGLVLSLIAVTLPTGCSTTPPYVPNASLSVTEATYWADRLLKEQPERFTPVSVEIKPDYFSTVDSRTRRSLLVGGVASKTVATTVYFDNIGKIELSMWRDIYVGVICDITGRPIFKYFHHNPEKTKKFMDAIESLKQARPRNAQESRLSNGQGTTTQQPNKPLKE